MKWLINLFKRKPKIIKYSGISGLSISVDVKEALKNQNIVKKLEQLEKNIKSRGLL